VCVCVACGFGLFKRARVVPAPWRPKRRVAFGRLLGTTASSGLGIGVRIISHCLPPLIIVTS
jgi:hypothetical protein